MILRGASLVEQGRWEGKQYKFGIAEGVSRFAETFKLVYMLQTPEDVMREIGVELEMPNIIKVKL